MRLWLPVIGAAAILVGVAMALWLDHSIAGAASGYLAALRSGRASDLRDLPAASGWGELSALGTETSALLTRAQQTGRAFEELGRLQKQLDDAHAVLDRWNREETWQPMPDATGALGVVTRILNEGIGRHEEVREQNREAALQIHRDLDQSLGDARHSAERTELGFVEATSLLTTIRELQRLSAELGREEEAGPSAPDPVAGLDLVRRAAAGAVGELVEASSESIRHLSAGLLRVREVADQVQIVGNRATLMALNAMIARRAGTAEADAAELKVLAAEVRASMDRVTALTRDVEGDIEMASQRMKGVRERVASALEHLPAPSPAPDTAPPKRRADLAHALERMREMIRDATVKSERLSSAGESASRAAERLVRHLEESTSELEALVIRLEPAGAPASGAAAGSGPAGPPASLRLLDADDVHPAASRPKREKRP